LNATLNSLPLTGVVKLTRTPPVGQNGPPLHSAESILKGP
jgi:hypothetical protein